MQLIIGNPLYFPASSIPEWGLPGKARAGPGKAH
jgi:hypothetical protein